MSKPKMSHYRICHHCTTLNTAGGELVQDCEGCGKHLAPFYFFDESKAMGIQNSDYYSTVNEALAAEAAELPLKIYPPIYGLTVYWES